VTACADLVCSYAHPCDVVRFEQESALSGRHAFA
jgi:hypothetical protein